MSLRVTDDCPRCKGHNTLRGVMSEGEMKRAGMIARCCYSCGYTNQNRLPKGTKAHNDRLAGQLVSRAQKFGHQVRDCTIGFRNGMWYPLSKAQSDARRAEAELVAATSRVRRDRDAGAVSGVLDEAMKIVEVDIKAVEYEVVLRFTDDRPPVEVPLKTPTFEFE